MEADGIHETIGKLFKKTNIVVTKILFDVCKKENSKVEPKILDLLLFTKIQKINSRNHNSRSKGCCKKFLRFISEKVTIENHLSANFIW